MNFRSTLPSSYFDSTIPILRTKPGLCFARQGASCFFDEVFYRTLIHLNQVLEHWACSKIQVAASITDADLMESIAERMKGHKGISFTRLAHEAQEVGRKALAALLLDLESNAAEQVWDLITAQYKLLIVVESLTECTKTLTLAGISTCPPVRTVLRSGRTYA